MYHWLPIWVAWVSWGRRGDWRGGSRPTPTISVVIYERPLTGELAWTSELELWYLRKRLYQHPIIVVFRWELPEGFSVRLQQHLKLSGHIMVDQFQQHDYVLCNGLLKYRRFQHRLSLSQPAEGVIGNIAGKQRIANNPSFHRGQVHPKSASSPAISDKRGQWISSKGSHTSPIEFIFGGGQDKYVIFIWL